MPLWFPFKTLRSRIAARVCLYGGAVGIGLPFAFSQVMIAPMRQPIHTAPAPFEDARVTSEGLSLRTWTLRGRPERAAVVVAHGVGDTLESFTGVAERLI